MPVKKIPKKPQLKPEQPHPGKDDSQRFVNEETRQRFDTLIKARKIHQEKGFLFQEAEHYGLPVNIAEIIDAHQWGKFAEHPSNPIVSLVREFYANIMSSQQTFSMVRGLKVSFSAASINLHFGLTDLEDEYSVLLENSSRASLDASLARLTVEGTAWIKEKGGSVMKCSRPDLLPLAKVWYHIIRTKLLPTTHIETVSKERLVLLDCILEKKGINVGKLIQQEISACASRQKGCLFFPSLITELCMRTGVEVSSADEMLLNSGMIDTNSIKRFAIPATKPSSEQATKSGDAGDISAQIQHLNEMIQRSLEQQKVFWAFVKAAHIWQKRVFELNLKHKILNPPLFPDELLASMPADQTTSAQVSSPEEPADDELDSETTPIHQPVQQDKAAKDSKQVQDKGKAVADDNPDADSDLGVTPSPPPRKKVKVATSAPLRKTTKSTTPPRKKRSQLTASEISHYYSSTDDEPAAPASKSPKKTVKSSGKKAKSAQPVAAPADAAESDLEIVREVQHQAAKTLRQMAESAKRRPGLRSAV